MNTDTITTSGWNGIGNYDFLYGFPDWAQKFAEESNPFFRGINGNTHSQHFYLVAVGEKIITPLPFLALAFGGQYNDDLPFTDEKTISLPSLNEILQYEFQLFSYRMMELDYKERKECASSDSLCSVYKIYSYRYALAIFSNQKDKNTENKSVVKDNTLHQTRMIIRLTAKEPWFLSVFFSDKTGDILQYSLDYEDANDSHYVFTDERSIRKAIYTPGDESRYLDQVLARSLVMRKAQELMELISPFIKEEYHY